MARRRRRGEDPIAGIGGLLILAAFWVWSKVGNTTFYVIIGSVFILTLGIIILLIRRRKQKLLDSGINVIDSMTGQMFEELILEHFRKLGYKGHMTPATADYGADLVLEKDEERLVAQIKRWKQKVGIEAVQQTVASINHYNANKGMVITNSYFTSNAEKLARSNNIELWNRDSLIDFLSKARGKEMAEEVATKQISSNDCPNCGNQLVLRNGKRGSFWGCSSFPKCRFTRDF
ncbi:MAG: restriction endonuclease [Bacillota bacterium]|nr:restriction endonuclease [Bacillota bacterium]